MSKYNNYGQRELIQELEDRDNTPLTEYLKESGYKPYSHADEPMEVFWSMAQLPEESGFSPVVII